MSTLADSEDLAVSTEKNEGYSEQRKFRQKLVAKPLNVKQSAVVAEAPESCKGIIKKAYSATSPAAGIKAMCLYCVGYLRAEVKNCTSFACPLWQYRPYQSEDED